jgi:hypothetical protein
MTIPRPIYKADNQQLPDKQWGNNPLFQSKKHNPLQKSAEMHIDKEVEMTANK